MPSECLYECFWICVVLLYAWVLTATARKRGSV